MGGKKVISYKIDPYAAIGEEWEFKPGDGVRVKNGKLIAIQPGILGIDTETNVMSVLPIPAGG